MYNTYERKIRHLIDRLISLFTYQGYSPADKFDSCDNPHGSFTSDAININRNYVNGTDTNRR